MQNRQPLAAVLSLLAIVALVTSLAAEGLSQTAAATPASPARLHALSNPTTSGLLPILPLAQSIWENADGPVIRREVERGWLLGPLPLAMTVERYDDSPTGSRALVYFDKGRLDILNTNAAPGDHWQAPGGQLVTELLAGALQLGASRWVEREPATVPVVGDPDQPNAVTYATLGAHATLPHSLRDGVAPEATARIGKTLTALLAADGSIDPNGHTGAAVAVADYDAVTRHNIAAPFKAWGEAQVYEWLYALGHPLTEPFWVDTVVGGTPQRVLVQAFERRVLSYTPANPAAWQTEPGNVGQHYRAWRGLSQPQDPALAPLVSGVPFGEEIVASALAAGVDPYLLAALATVASDGDPFRRSEVGRGLLGVLTALAPATDDPALNAAAGAGELARLLSETGSERAALAAYRAGDTAFADAVLAARDALRSSQARPDGLALQATVSQPLPQIASGAATAFAAGYDGGWWTRQLAWTAAWGGVAEGWTPDPAGHYCLRAGHVAGDRLRLVANGVSIDCTVGGEAGRPNIPAAGDGVVTLTRAAFDALTLDGRNDVRVFRLGPAGGQRTANAWAINHGPAAYYAAGYDVGWWERTLSLYESWGGTAAGWSVDPHGFYCVHPGYIPGQRLRLVANGVTLDCTIGDTVQAQHLAMWQARWAVELSWDTFVALGLPGNNTVEVYAIP